MALKVYDIHELRKQAREGVRKKSLTYGLPSGEIRRFEIEVKDGQYPVYRLGKPLGELLTTPAGLDALLKKTVVDVDYGREQVPLLYQPIYRRIQDERFPRFVDTRVVTQARAVFLEHYEGAEVRFGSRVVVGPQQVEIKVWTTGFEWSEESQEFDETWALAEFNRSIGEAYNALLNHLHLGPIITYNYPAKNKTAASTSGQTYFEKLRNTIRNALKHAAQDKNPVTGRGRRPTILLANSVNRQDIEDLFSRQQINGTVYPPISGIDVLIFYDGWEIAVGGQTYSYPGVPADKVYLIEPQRVFVELVKHDLRVDALDADLSRLRAGGIVARAYRGVLAVPEDAVEEVTLPAA